MYICIYNEHILCHNKKYIYVILYMALLSLIHYTLFTFQKIMLYIFTSRFLNYKQLCTF